MTWNGEPAYTLRPKKSPYSAYLFFIRDIVEIQCEKATGLAGPGKEGKENEKNKIPASSRGRVPYKVPPVGDPAGDRYRFKVRHTSDTCQHIITINDRKG